VVGDVIGRALLIAHGVTFTDPHVCAVGLTVDGAGEQGYDVRVVTTPVGGVAGA